MRHLQSGGRGDGRPILDSLERREMLTAITATLATGVADGTLAKAAVPAITITFSETVTGFDKSSLTLFHNNDTVDLTNVTLIPSGQSPDKVWTLAGLAGITDFVATNYSLNLAPAGIAGKAAGTEGDAMADPANASWTTAAVPDVQVVATDSTASEFDPADPTGTITVSRTLISDAPMTVKIHLGGTARNRTDYAALANIRSVTIPASNASTDLTIAPINSHRVTADQTVVVGLVANKALYAIDPVEAAGTVTIFQASSTVSLVATDRTAGEADLSTGTYTLTRSGDATLPLAVYVRLSGTARLGRDYSLSVDDGNSLDMQRGVVTLGAGHAAAVVTLTPINNLTGTGTLTAKLTLGRNRFYWVDALQASGTVMLADAQSSVSIIADQPQATWQGATGSFTIIRTGPTGADQVVKLRLSGSARYNIDFGLSIVVSAVTIPAGSSSATITVITPKLIGSIHHPVRTVVFQILPNGSNYALDKISGRAIVTISDAMTP